MPIGKTLCNDSDNDSIDDENHLLFGSDDENENEEVPTKNEITDPPKMMFFKKSSN